MKGIQYKDTFAQKGSELWQALTDGDKQKAKAIYDDTTQRALATYGKDLYELPKILSRTKS